MVTVGGLLALGVKLKILAPAPSATNRSPMSLKAMPAKPQIGRDDKLVRAHNGKAQYSQIIAFRNRELADRFSDAVLALIRAEHPEALDGDEP